MMLPAAQADLIEHPGVPFHEGHVAFNSDGHHHHHFHREQHRETPPDAQEGHDIAHQLSGNQDYDAAAVWVNENYLVFDRPNSIDGMGGGSTEPDSLFSHGFIIEQPGPTPEYEFIGREDPGLSQQPATCTLEDGFCLFDHNGRGFDPRSRIREAFATWSRLTVDDPHLIMGLEFREKVGDDTAEIAVQFVDFQPIPRNIAAWIPRFGAPRVKGTLFFRRYDNAMKTRKHEWFTGDRANDIADNARVTDFLTSALHETGHIVGLDHQNDTDDIMYIFAGDGDKVRAGGAFRRLSGDDILGARDLYSITPEPSTVTLVGVGMVVMIAFGSLRRGRTVKDD